MKIVEKYSLLLLRPDYMAENYGTDTILMHVEAETPLEALGKATTMAAKIDEVDNPDDYYCLLCAEGWIKDLSDGRGSVVS